MKPLDPNAAAAPDSGIFGLSDLPEDARVVLVPVPWEATTSYGGGTVDGPRAILQASRQVDLFDIETGRPYVAGIALLPELGDVRRWNDAAQKAVRTILADDSAANADLRTQVDELSERMNAHVQSTVQRWLDAGKLVGVVGGDHSVAFGAIAAHAARYPGLGILHFDAHADLRRAYSGFEWSHASIMENVVRRVPAVSKLVQVGIRDLCEEEHERIAASLGRVRTFYDAELARERFGGVSWAQQVERMLEDLPREIYVSFDIDGLDPVLCPHTGTPVPGGLSFQEACYVLSALVASGRRIVGFDLVEVAPAADGSEWDGNVAARLLYKLIGWALRSQNP